MEISVFTPSHSLQYLQEAYNSLAAQTLPDWEWVLMLNGKAKKADLPEQIQQDERVKVYEKENFPGVGAAKAACIAHCRGKYLLELDHDDLLTPTALERTLQAFEQGHSFVYSNTIRIQPDGSPELTRYGADFGWQFRGTQHNGRIYMECLSFEPSAQSLSLIWFMPNHLRAFTRELYDKVGGYDPTLDVNDDQDLMQRMYIEDPRFYLIDKALYLQRIHHGQTQLLRNEEIQQKNHELYHRYFEQVCLSWAKSRSLDSLELGSPGAHNQEYSHPQGLPQPTLQQVLDGEAPLPFSDNSLGLIRAADLLCLAADPVHLINEIYRVLAHGGVLLSETPSTDGRGAFQDPRHRSFWNQNSFWYYTQSAFARYIPHSLARFQVSHLETYFPDESCKAHNISYVKANLSAVKAGPRLPGKLTI